MNKGYGLRVGAPVRRSLEEGLPFSAAAAVWEFCNGALRKEPYRVGKPLREDLEGFFSARRGPYRVIYQINEKERVVELLRVEHRADVYRRRR